MKNPQTIDKEIAALKEELANVTGTPTEVYTRIVGYYRSVNNWNKGKREEYNIRTEYSPTSTPSDRKKGDAVSYKYFFRQTCPNCPPVKAYIASMEMTGDEIDVDTEAGLEEARMFDVFASPTVIFFDAAENEVFRAHNVEGITDRQLTFTMQ